MWLAPFVSRFARGTTLTWHNFLVASDSDLRIGKLWAANRGPVVRRLEARHMATTHIDLLTFEDVLSDAELDVLKNYKQLHSNTCAWSHNQYP